MRMDEGLPRASPVHDDASLAVIGVDAFRCP